MDDHEDEEFLLEDLTLCLDESNEDSGMESADEQDFQKKYDHLLRKFNHGLSQSQGLFEKCSTPIEESIVEFNHLADELDIFHKRTTIASITGSAVSIAGGVTTIVGLILIPFTFGASLIVTGVGLGVGTAAGLAGAAASLADFINSRIDCKKVEEKLRAIQKDLDELSKRLDEVHGLNEEINNLTERHPDIKVSVMDAKFVQQFARGSIRLAGTCTAAVRLAELGRLAGMTARAAKAATAISGVLAGLVIVFDAALIVQDARDLHKGAKSQAGAQIREKAKELSQVYQNLSVIVQEMKLASSDQHTPVLCTYDL